MRNRGIGYFRNERSPLECDLGYLVVDPCIRAWAFGSAEWDSSRELDLDLGSVDYHMDQCHCSTLDLDLDYDLDFEFDHDADLDFLEGIGVQIVEQEVDHCWEKLEYVGVSLLTVVD
jgi:hypothetical protein